MKRTLVISLLLLSFSFYAESQLVTIPDSFSGCISIASQKWEGEQCSGFSNDVNNTAHTEYTTYSLPGVLDILLYCEALHQVDLGKLELTNPISKYINIPENYLGPIPSVSDIMNHKSGYVDYSTSVNYPKFSLRSESVQRCSQFIIEQTRIDSLIGKRYFSRSNDILLMAILESVGKQDIDELLDRDLFQAYHMKQTGLQIPGKKKSESSVQGNKLIVDIEAGQEEEGSKQKLSSEEYRAHVSLKTIQLETPEFVKQCLANELPSHLDSTLRIFCTTSDLNQFIQAVFSDKSNLKSNSILQLANYLSGSERYKSIGDFNSYGYIVYSEKNFGFCCFLRYNNMKKYSISLQSNGNFNDNSQILKKTEEWLNN